MPTPTWHDVWHRRSRLRLRPASQRTHRNPTAGQPVIALDDEIPEIETPPEPQLESGGDLDLSDEDDADPQYQLFLNHLKADGKSYRLELTPVSLKYEDDGDYCNATPPATEDRGRAKAAIFPECRVANMRNKRCEADAVDEDYRMFLTRAREDDGGLVLEVDGGAAVKYEEEEDDDYRLFLNRLKEGNDSVVLESDNDTTGNFEDDDYRFFLNHLEEYGGSVVLESGGDATGKHNEEDGDEDDDYRFFLNHLEEYGGSVVLESGGDATGKHNEEDGDEDEDYRFFLNQLKEHGDSVILEWDNNVTVKEEDDDFDNMQEENLAEELHNKPKDSNGCCVSNTKTALLPCSTSPQPPNNSAHEDDECSIETERYTPPSLYADRLKIILDKPFDQNEYDRLMKLATDRKLTTKHRVLRKMDKSYSTRKVGRSYLELYPKFDKMLKCAADHYAALTLLRGFFYWLKNMVQDGAFMPWERASSSYETLSPSGCSPMLPILIDISED